MSKIVVLKPQAPEVTAFVYENVSDLQNLAAFVGRNPVVDFTPKGVVYKFRNQIISDGSVVFRNEFGAVIKVMTIEEMEKMYDLVRDIDFVLADHTNHVKTKEITGEPKKS